MELPGAPPAAADSDFSCALSRLFFRALQGSLFPTQLQLGRQLAKKCRKTLQTPKERFAQGHLPQELKAELSQGGTGSPSESLSKDCALQTSQHLQQPPVCSPEASGEPSTVDTSVPLRENSPRGSPGSSIPGAAVSGECPGHLRRKSLSTSRAAPLQSLFSLPNFSSLGCVSSLSLVSGLGSVLRFSSSSLHVDKRDSEFLSSSPQPEQDLSGLQRQATGYV